MGWVQAGIHVGATLLHLVFESAVWVGIHPGADLLLVVRRKRETEGRKYRLRVYAVQSFA